MTEKARNLWRDAEFRKSSFSGQNAECVEVARGGAAFGVRDSKNAAGPVLALSIHQGHALLAAAREGRLDR